MANAEISGDASHKIRWPSRSAWQSAAIQLGQSEISRAGAEDCSAVGATFRAQPLRHRLANRQRICRAVLRRRNAKTISGLAQGTLRFTRQPECPLDYAILE